MKIMKWVFIGAVALAIICGIIGMVSVRETDAYLDSNLLDVFALLFPFEYEKRVAQLMKEGDPE